MAEDVQKLQQRKTLLEIRHTLLTIQQEGVVKSGNRSKEVEELSGRRLAIRREILELNNRIDAAKS